MLDFPSSPTVGLKYPATPITGIPTYTWDGEKWTTQGPSIGGQFVLKAGDTMTGDLTISKATPVININKPSAGSSANIIAASNGLSRWAVNLGNNTAESGANAGSDFGLARFDDAGAVLGFPLNITRSTGLAIVEADPTAALGVATKQYVDSSAGLAAAGMQINGGMEFDQANAGASVVIGAGASGGKSIDSWGFNAGGTSAAFTLQQVQSVFPGFNKELKLTVTTAQPTIGASIMDIEAYIEGYRIARLAPGTASAKLVTIGFWVKSSVAGTFPVYLCNNNISSLAQGNITITAANVAQYVNATIQVPTTGTWLTDNSLGMVLKFRVMQGGFNIAATVGNTFEITGLVVLPGALTITAAQSPLLMRPYDQELQLCKRYFYNGIPPLRGVVSGSTTGSRLGARHPVTMRATPTLILTAPLFVFDGTSPTNLTAIVTNFSTPDVIECEATIGAGLTVGRVLVVYQQSGNLNVDARL